MRPSLSVSSGDLPGEEVEREFFEDTSCYPKPTEEP
jgi:hypothetical protein